MLSMFKIYPQKRFYPKLQDFLTENLVRAEIIDQGVPMKTADSVSFQLGIASENIFNSILLCYKKTKSIKEYAMVVLPGNNRINFEQLAKALEWSVQKISFAHTDDLLDQTGFIAGGIPPIGHKENFPIILDKRLFEYEIGYAGAGSPELLLKISPQEIYRVIQLTREPIIIDVTAQQTIGINSNQTIRCKCGGHPSPG